VPEAAAETLRRLPKIELHRHLEGSVRLETFLQVAKANRLPLPSYELQDMRWVVEMTDEPPGFHRFMRSFPLLRQMYVRPEIIQRVTYEAIADAAADNIKYLELRFSPEHLGKERGYDFKQVIAWVVEARHHAAQQYGITVSLLATIGRGYAPAVAEGIVEAVLAQPEGTIVGIDLAGDEINYPVPPFAETLRRAQSAGLGLTVHAGEARGAESVKLALESFNPQRIGHGVRAIEDPEVIAMLRDRQVTLEVCPTSNLQTGAVPSLPAHPLKTLHEQGVRVTVNTDDPRISRITLTEEYQLAMNGLGVTLSELKAMILNAARAAFLPQEEKTKLEAWFQRELVTAQP